MKVGFFSEADQWSIDGAKISIRVPPMIRAECRRNVLT